MTLMANLLNLHMVDKQVRGLRSRLTGAERYLNAQQKQVDLLVQDKAEAESRLKQTQATIGNCENDIRAIDERLEKLRDELNNTQTNKQYTAVLTELNTVKLQRQQLEDRTLELMEEVEQAKTAHGEVDEQIAEREKVRDHAKEQLKERKQDVGDRLAELETERQGAAAVIPASVLATFDTLAEDYEGEAMAHVEEVSRRHREYACGLCMMQIPFERVSLLMSNQDEVTTCASCQRILYLEEEMRGALAGKK